MVDMMPRMSTLNPNAPLFVPASYVATEDFSVEWWHLIQTSPAFRDYWLIERSDIMDDEFVASPLDDVDDFEDLLELELQCQELENDAPKQGNGTVHNVEKDVLYGLASLGVNDSKSQQRIWREPLKHHEKISNRSPRSPKKGGNTLPRIQQPRA